jgi:predicted ester cyclase
MAAGVTETNPFLGKVIDVYNSHRLERFDTILTDDCVLVRNGVEARGREAVKRVLDKLYRAFPDIEYRVDDAVISGDKMALRWRGRATHRGEYLGIEATGRQVDYGGITVYELRGDQIARIWVSADLLALARSLSAAASPAAEHP